MTADRDRLLEVRGLTKGFPGLQALDGVDLDVGAGEIVALVGANGSGKSTLVKTLAGVHQADAGTVRTAEGRELHFIHQDLGVVAMLSTVENLDLGREYGARVTLPVRRRPEVERARDLIGEFGASFDVRAPMAQLTAAERTIVAIARALDGWAAPDNVLVLDEPTAALHGDEVDKLFEAIRRVAKRGAGVLFISHRLDEVMVLADRVVALRDGRKVADVPVEELDHDGLVRLIAGRDVVETKANAATKGEVVLSVRGLESPTIRGLDFDLRRGEIVGVTGLLGSGREHLSRVLFGVLARTGGEVRLDGDALPTGAPGACIQRGLGLVPADRHQEGAVMQMTVRENLTLPRLRPFRRLLGRLDTRAEREETVRWIDRVGLRPPAPDRTFSLLSGGNQQKVVLAKWLRNSPKVLLLDEPTQGVDIGAKAAIYELLLKAADDGAGVLVASSDTKELALLCDRVLVLRDGVLVSQIDRSDLDEGRMVRDSLGLSGEVSA